MINLRRAALAAAACAVAAVAATPAIAPRTRSRPGRAAARGPARESNPWILADEGPEEL